MADKPTIGVLALQGDFEAHRRALDRAGADAVEVRTADELRAIDGLVIPGGESTAMLKLLEVENFFQPLKTFGQHKPIFGTCAGAILLATEVQNPAQASLGLMDLTVERNAYGRQIDSRIAQIDLDNHKMEAVFIRAPILRRVGPMVKILASFQGHAVLVEQGLHMAATFHPELTNESSVHQFFIRKVSALTLVK